MPGIVPSPLGQTLQNYIDDVQEILHDVTASSWSLARVISRINEARLDVARDTHCIRQLVTGVQLIPGVEIYNLNGAVAGATVTSAGSNYGSGGTIPVIFSAPPAGGIQALGTGVLTAGSLTSITMTQWGAGYVQPPTITVGGMGSGAAATPVVLFNSNPLATTQLPGMVLAVVSITFIWNGERRFLKYANFSLFQGYARLWVQNFNAPPGIWTHHQQQQLVYIQPPPDQLYQSEWDIVTMPSPLIATTDIDNQIIDPWGRAVQFRAAENLLYKHANIGHAKAMGDRYAEFVPHIITTSGGVRIPNIYNRNFQRRIMR
jgi:hypothetical protein